MAKRSTNVDSMGDEAPGQVQSPMSFQRTDGDSVDSLLEPRPEPASYSPPKDTIGLIPKPVGMGKV